MNFKNRLIQFLNLDKENDYFLTQGSYLGFSHIVSIICGFLLSIAFANFLPKEIFGQYRYILSVVAVLTIFTLPGLKTAITQATARGFEGCFKRGIKTRLKWGILASLVSFLIAIYFWIQNNSTFAAAFSIAGILFPISASFNLYLNYLAGKMLFKTRTKYEIFTRVLSLIFLVVALLLTSNLIILVLVYFSTDFLLNLIFLLKTITKFPPNTKKDFKTTSYGKHLSIVEALSSLTSYMDRILIYAFLSPTDLAIYSFAIMPIEQVKGLLKNIKILALPKFSVKSRENLRKNIAKKTKKTILIIIILIIIYFFLSPYLYKIFFPQYNESLSYSRTFAISLLSTPIFLLLAALEAKMMKKELYKLYGLTFFIQITALLVLIPLFGILGAVLARIIGRIISFLWSLLLTKKCL